MNSKKLVIGGIGITTQTYFKLMLFYLTGDNGRFVWTATFGRN